MLTRRSYVTQVKHKIQVTRVKRNERWTQIASTEGKLHASKDSCSKLIPSAYFAADKILTMLYRLQNWCIYSEIVEWSISANVFHELILQLACKSSYQQSIRW